MLPSLLRRFVLALGVPLVGFGLRFVLDELIGPDSWYVTSFVAVFLVAWLGGLSAGLIAVLVTIGLVTVLPADATRPDLQGLFLERNRQLVELVDGVIAAALGTTVRQGQARVRSSSVERVAAVEHAATSGERIRIVASTAEELAGRLSPLQVADIAARRLVEVSGATGARVRLTPVDGRTMDATLETGEVGPSPRLTIGRVIPLVAGADVLGTVELWEPDSNPSAGEAEEPEPMADATPDREAEAIIVTMSRLAGEAIARSRLVDSQRDSRRRLERASARVRRIQVLSAELARAAGSREIARAIVEQAVDEVRAGVGLLYLARPDGRSFVLAHSRGYPSGLVDRQAVIEIDAPLPAAVVARTGRRVVVGSPAEWRSAYPGGSDILGMTGTRSLVALPIRAEGEIRAVLVLLLPGDVGPAAEDLAFLELVCEQAAQALERARLYEAVADRDRRLELTLGASRTGTWELDIATGELTLSEEFRRLHGLPDASEPAGIEGYVGLVAPGDRDRVRDAIRATLESGTPFDLGYQIDRPAGDRAWVHGVGRVFIEDAGRGSRIMGTERDTTGQFIAEAERDALLDQEREARQLQEAFVGVVSHELRTPITTLLAGSKILRRDKSLSDRARDLATDVEEEADRLYRLVEDLLVLTRLERGNLEVGVEPVHLRHLITRIAAAEQARWPVTRIIVRHDGATHLAKGEETYVEQVLRNLLANAAKYSPPGSTVEVSLEPRDDEIAIRVLDEGPGIESGEIDQLFTLFYRSPSTAAKASGAGIGLFVCNRLVEAMGGRTWARRRRGTGSEFGFALRHYEDVDDLPGADDGPKLVGVGEAAEAVGGSGSNDRGRRAADGVTASSG